MFFKKGNKNIFKDTKDTIFTRFFIKIMLIMFILILSIFSNSLAVEKQYYLGDVNLDGKVTLTDQLVLLRHIYSQKTGKKVDWLLKDDSIINADVNESGKIDLTDVLSICRYIASSKSSNVKDKHPDWLTLCKKITKTESEESYTLTVNPDGTKYTQEPGSAIQISASGANYQISFNANGGSTPNSQISVRDFESWGLSGFGTISNKTSSTTTYTFGNGNAELTAFYKESGQEIVLPDTKKTGYILDGWYSDAEFKNLIGKSGAKYVPTSSLTLYAKWTEDSQTPVDPPDTPIQPVSISLNKDSLNLVINNNPTEKLEATISPSNAETQITWKSSNDTVATVSQDGLVTAKSEGKAIITATTDNGKVANCQVTVTMTSSEIKNYSLTVNPGESHYSQEAGTTVQISAPVSQYIIRYNANGGTTPNSQVSTRKFIAWKLTGSGSINNESSSSIIYTFGNGNGELTASYDTNGKEITLPSSTKNGYIFEGWYLDAEFKNYIGKSGEKYVPTSNLTLYAKWSEDSQTPVDPPDTPVKPTSIKLNKTLLNLVINTNPSEKLEAIVAPSNAETTITWDSSNDTVATVSQDGLVTAKSEGRTIITATTDNGKIASCQVSVSSVELPETPAPIVKIETPYEGKIITAGSKVQFPITIVGDNITNTNKNKIKLSGSLANSSSLVISGSGNSYTAEVTVADEVGTLGIYVEEGMVTNSSDKTNSKVQKDEDYVFTLNESTASDYISVAVGVHNSFYIKSYDYYLDDEKIIGNRTTNDYTFSGLTEGKTYNVKVKVNIYKNKTSDEIISGWLEKDITVKSNNGLEVHFIDVVEGIAAADCTFIKTKNGKTIMIDTGADDSGDSYVNKVAEIDKYLRKEKNSKDGTSLVNAVNGVVHIDYAILTHSHIDHIGGFAGLTGVHYQASNPGYFVDNNNTINGEKVRYEFDNIVLNCNAKVYNGNEVLTKDGVPIKDGAEGNDTTQSAKSKAIYCYANNTNKLITVKAGNVLKIDNTIFNIFFPYDPADLPTTWLYTSTDASGNSTSGVREKPQILSSRGNAFGTTMTLGNNSSIVIKVMDGSRKLLLMGDSEFLVEEFLLGIPSKQILSKNSNLNNGLKIDSSTGGQNSDNKTLTSYVSLVNDLLTHNYGGCSSLDELEQKYKLSRFTEKDIFAQVLKKGHHHVRNSTSIPFLNVVRPNKVVVSGIADCEDSTVRCVEIGVDYRLRQYYKSSYVGTAGNIPVNLTSSNWFEYIYGVDYDLTNKSKGSFYIYTTTGRSWNYTNPDSK